MVRRDVDEAVDVLARRQFGAFSDLQVTQIGGSAKLRRSRVRSGRWLRLCHGALALPSHPPTWERQASAATLALPGSVLTHQAGGALLFDGVPMGRVRVAVPHGSHRVSPLAEVHQSQIIEATRFRGLPVVTPAHCLIQLAACYDEARFARIAGAAFVATPRLLGELGDRYVDLASSRLPGLHVVRAVLDRYEAEVPDESVLEVLLDDAMRLVPGMPRVERQAPFPWWPEGKNRIDRWVPEWRLIVEGDGRAWHTRIEDFERDHWRDNEANAHRCHVMRFTWPVLDGHPEVAVGQMTTYAATLGLAA